MIELKLGDCLERMKEMPDESVELTVTSPPYDNLRKYNGRGEQGEAVWKAAIRELYRVTDDGGAVVWVAGDATVRGSETGTSFKQALWAMECGFRLHDTMIWNKQEFTAVGSLVSRYAPVFEYMFVLTKGAPRTFNPIKDRRNKHAGSTVHGTIRTADGSLREITGAGEKTIAEFGQRHNVWEMPGVKSRKDTRHPAPFPEALAHDHIASWSRPSDRVFDPFMGGGTTGLAAAKLGRHFIGIEIEPEYHAIAHERLAEYAPADALFDDL